MAAAPPFNPASIPGLTVWLDATSFALANNADVITWTNKIPAGSGGAGDALSGPYGSSYPKFKTAILDNKGVIEFAKTSGSFLGNTGQVGTNLGNKNWSVFYVGRVLTNPGGRLFGSDNSNSTRNVTVGYTLDGYGGDNCCYDNAFLTNAGGTYTKFPSTWVVNAYNSTSSTGTDQSGIFTVDGVQKGGYGSVGLGLGGKYCLNGYNDSASTESCSGQIAEVFFFNRPLNSTEQTQIREYLSAKWLNQIGQTQAFDWTSASWVKGATTATANLVAGPNGVVNADKVAATTANAQHYIYIGYAHTDLAPFTFSVYVKNAGGNGQVLLIDFNVSASATFTIGQDAVTSTSGPIAAAVSEPGLPNGWHRISITTNSDGKTNANWGIYLNGGASYAGDGTSGLYLWGAELVRSSRTSATPWAPPVTPATGTLSSTLDNATFVGTAAIPVAAALSSTLGNATCVGTAAVRATAALSSALGNATFVGTATAPATCALSRTLGDATLTGAVLTSRSALLDVTLGDAVLTSVVRAVATGTLSRTLDDVVLTSVSKVVAHAALNRVLDPVVLDSVSGGSVTGISDNTLAPLTLVAAAGATVNAALDQTLDPVTAEGIGGFPGAARLFEWLDDVTLTSAGTVSNRMVLNEFLDNTTVASSGLVLATASLTRLLATLVGTGLGAQVNTYRLSATLQDVTAFAAAFTYVANPSIRYGSVYSMLDGVVVSASAGTVAIRAALGSTLNDAYLTSAAGVVVTLRSVLNMDRVALVAQATGVAGGTLDYTLDDARLFSAADLVGVAGATLTLANTQLVGNAKVAATGAMSATLGNAVMAGQGSVRITAGMPAVTLDPLTLTSAGGVYHVGNLDVTLDKVVLDSQGGPILGVTLNRVLGDVTLVSVAQSPAICTLMETLEDLAGVVAGQAYAGGTLSATLDSATLVFDATAESSGVAVPVLDGLVLVADGQSIISGTYTTTLGDAALLAAGSGVATGTLDQVFDDLVGSGTVIHVRRTPTLHAFVFVNYVTASVSVEAVYAEVTADVIHAVTIIEDTQRYA